MVWIHVFFCFIFITGLLFATTSCLSNPGNLARKVSLKNAEVKDGRLGQVLDGQRSALATDHCSRIQGTDAELHVLLTSTVNVIFVLIYVNVSSDDVSRSTATFGQLNVIVGNDVCSQQNFGQLMAGRLSIVCTEPVLGSRVILQLPGPNRTLRICEVEVYDIGCDCLDGCHANEKEWCYSSCPRQQCINRENVAFRKPTSSSWLTDSSESSDIVVNGHTPTDFNLQKPGWIQQASCIMTSSLNASQWWSVDLEREVPVRSVVIYRSNAEQVVTTETLTEITVDGKKCATYGPETLSAEDAVRPKLVIECDRVVRGREVKVSRIRVFKSQDPAPLRLCEAEVWSCKPGWFGPGCRSKCGQCRDGRTTCDAVTGHCPVACKAGWFGPRCMKKCPPGCLDNVCHQDSGQCFKCLHNAVLPYCTACKAGWFGPTCMTKCPPGCLDNVCHQDSGHCFKCPHNAELPFCTGDDNGSSSDTNDGVVAGAVVGGVLVFVVIALGIVFVVWCRRRRRDLPTRKKPVQVPPVEVPPGPAACSPNGKPEVTKADSYPYTEAMSSNNTDITTINGAVADSIYDDISEGPCYDSLQLGGSSYENADSVADKHDYAMPVFRRMDSQTSDGYERFGVHIGQ